jgi:hypothetical protein
MGCFTYILFVMVDILIEGFIINVVDKKIIMPIQDGFSRWRLRLKRQWRQKERGE